jgi:hypothetical protein
MQRPQLALLHTDTGPQCANCILQADILPVPTPALLTRLLSPHGHAVAPQALNVLMLKILENSNRNYTFSALLSLLLEPPIELTAGATTAGGAQLQQARWADLVVKCLIKSTKALPQVIEVRTLCTLCMHGPERPSDHYRLLSG